ncbi:YARHG domain-containing protein [Flammeovirga sp. SJP92]|uniref:YARHG domain-containing protein n=1 Tax=Flammeovirga sp. SJP92 TaxID=1775430 RepID=UPI000786E2AB|nr:YARHG domain-containing protein [Flammeovirga sp. SJP92]KXX67041.1 hypothetical protein AVL50_29145 [Flammeovirga sp. SJP92]
MRATIYFILFLFTIKSNSLAQESTFFDEVKKLQVNTQIPNEIAEKHLGATRNYLGEIQPVYLRYRRVFDSLIYIIVDQHISVGNYTNLYVIKDEVEKAYSLEWSFDQDGANAKATSASYQFLKDDLIEVHISTETVADTSTYDENFNMKTGFSFHNQKTVFSDQYHYLQLLHSEVVILEPSKTISEQRKYKIASSKILNEKDIQNLSQKELRIMRNEIFADYGYIFKSADMKHYFSSFEWYKPEKVAVTEEQLTAIEQLNVKYLLGKEKEIKSHDHRNN